MSKFLVALRNNLKAIFSNIRSGLKTELELQIAVYRDYEIGLGKVLEYSPWRSSPEDLITFLESQYTPSCSEWRRAVELALQHASSHCYEYNLKSNVITSFIC